MSGVEFMGQHEGDDMAKTSGKSKGKVIKNNPSQVFTKGFPGAKRGQK